ncbi:hypothetical protein M5689_000945 [Euphorbia peplus]|nr:hypothetical protein M5689_000945 [Euphorbia peplus]
MIDKMKTKRRAIEGTMSELSQIKDVIMTELFKLPEMKGVNQKRRALCVDRKGNEMKKIRKKKDELLEMNE